MRANEVSGVGQFNDNYTPVKVKDKDSGKSFVINFVNAKVTGNENEWIIKDGKLYDKNGKAIEDNIMEVTRYQAALIKAAAAGPYDVEDHKLDQYDIMGAAYAEKAEQELQKAKSEYKLDTWEAGYIPGENGEYVPRIVSAADASESGIFSAEVVNSKGDKGKLVIDIRTEEQLEAEKQRAEEAKKYFEKDNKPWWKFW